jgi:hypothetical protein
MLQETIIEFDKVDKQGDIFQEGCFDLTQKNIPIVTRDRNPLGIAENMIDHNGILMISAKYNLSLRRLYDVKNKYITIGFIVNDCEWQGSIRKIRKATICEFIHLDTVEEIYHVRT